MKAESNIQPAKFEIENIKEDRCEIVINSNFQEIADNENTKYTFDSYRLEVCYNKDLKNDVENNYEKYLEIAKNNEEKALSAEIRKRRDELLRETDQEMCIDRLNFNFPENLSMTNIISSLKDFFDGFANISKSNIAKYRQALRDIPQQEGFPYNIIWPNKEDLK